jgi:hypothetical protein
MVINQVNNQLSRLEEGGTVVPQRLTFPESRDVILSELTTHPLGAKTVVGSTATKPSETIVSHLPATQNITEKSMTFTKVLNGKTYVSRLIMPGESGKAKVFQLINDDSEMFSQYNTPPIPGVKIEFSLLGIAGFRTFQVIGVKNLPKPYDKGKVVFQIMEVKHSVNSDGWRTNVTALIRPLKSLETTLKP